MADTKLARSFAMCEGLPVSRRDARLSGKKKYFTGKPCIHGHVAARDTGKGQCLECAAESSLTWKKNNRQEHNRRNLLYISKNRDKIKEYHQKRYIENKTEIDARNKNYAAANRDTLNASCKRWRTAHPEERRALEAVRRARKAGAHGRYTATDIRRIRTQQRDKCACCKTSLKGKGEIDHIEPLARGGSNEPRNLQLLCGPCNSTKNARDPIDFMRSRGFLL